MELAIGFKVLLWVVAVALVVVGLIGVLLPALPGPAFILGGVVVAAAIDSFARIGPWTLLFLSVVAVSIIGIDYGATALGAKQFGGSKWGIAGAIVGVIVGLFFPPFGVLLGPFLGAVALELAGARKTSQEALKAGFGSFLGFILGTAVRYALAFMMVGVAVAAYLYTP